MFSGLRLEVIHSGERVQSLEVVRYVCVSARPLWVESLNP